MTTEKELKANFTQWCKKHCPDKAASKEELNLAFFVFMQAINAGKSFPDRPNHTHVRNPKLKSLAGNLAAVPPYTKTELSYAVAEEIFEGFIRKWINDEHIGKGFFTLHWMRLLVAEVYEQTIEVASRESECKAKFRSWKTMDAPLIALCKLRMMFPVLASNGEHATAQETAFRELAKIALLDGAFKVSKPNDLIGQVLDMDWQQIQERTRLGN